MHRFGTLALAALMTLGLAAAPLAARSATPTALPPSPGPPAESFDSGMLHVDRYGAGAQAVVLIPGLSCGPWEWYGVIAHLAPKYTVYALTLPGFDGRPASAKKPLISAFVTDFGALLDAHKIVKPIVVGHSLGGTLAIVLGERMPLRLKSIVAVDGLPVFPTVASMTADQRVAAALQMAAPLANDSPTQFAAGNSSFMSSYGTSVPALVEPASVELSKSDPLAAAAWLQEDVAGDWRPALREIALPLTEIMPYYAPDHTGPPLPYTQDQTQAFYASLLAGAPHLTIVPIAQARHFVMLDQPDAFDAALDPLLAK
jgi:pimeloyl-ACP methyl ester carboxylesterase